MTENHIYHCDKMDNSYSIQIDILIYKQEYIQDKFIVILDYGLIKIRRDLTSL